MPRSSGAEPRPSVVYSTAAPRCQIAVALEAAPAPSAAPSARRGGEVVGDGRKVVTSESCRGWTAVWAATRGGGRRTSAPARRSARGRRVGGALDAGGDRARRACCAPTPRRRWSVCETAFHRPGLSQSVFTRPAAEVAGAAVPGRSSCPTGSKASRSLSLPRRMRSLTGPTRHAEPLSDLVVRQPVVVGERHCLALCVRERGERGSDANPVDARAGLVDDVARPGNAGEPLVAGAPNRVPGLDAAGINRPHADRKNLSPVEAGPPGGGLIGP